MRKKAQVGGARPSMYLYLFSPFPLNGLHYPPVSVVSPRSKHNRSSLRGRDSWSCTLRETSRWGRKQRGWNAGRRRRARRVKTHTNTKSWCSVNAKDANRTGCTRGVGGVLGVVCRDGPELTIVRHQTVSARLDRGQCFGNLAPQVQVGGNSRKVLRIARPCQGARHGVLHPAAKEPFSSSRREGNHAA